MPKKNMKTKKGSRSGESKQRSVPVAYGRGTQNRTRSPPPVKHSEFLGNVSGNEDFSVVSYALNPGLVESFPWLHKQAAGWEFYRFRKLTVRYETRSPSAQAGSVMFVIDYKSSDGPPTDEKEANNSSGAREGVIWRELRMGLNVSTAAAISPWKLIRTQPSAEPLIDFDVGRLHVAVTGVTGTAAPALLAVGKLWLDLEVDFKTAVQRDSLKVKKMGHRHSHLHCGVQAFPPAKALAGIAFHNTDDTNVTNDDDGLGLMNTYDPVTKRVTPPRGRYRISHGCETINNDIGPSRHGRSFMKNGTAFGGGISSYSARLAGQIGNKMTLDTTQHFNGTDTFGIEGFADAALGIVSSAIGDLLFTLL